jgi:hypothetical protein
MADDIVRVFRILEYVGPRSFVEMQLRHAVHGTKNFGNIALTATTLGEFPEIVKRAADLKTVGTCTGRLPCDGSVHANPPKSDEPDLRIHYGDGETPNARCGAVTIEQSMVPEHVECKRCWLFVKAPRCSECGRPLTQMTPTVIQRCVDHPSALIIELGHG